MWPLLDGVLPLGVVVVVVVVVVVAIVVVVRAWDR